MRKLMSLALALVLSLALAAPATAAPAKNINCEKCGADFETKNGSNILTIFEVYGVESIPGLSDTLWEDSSGEVFDFGNSFCHTCTDTIAQAYLATLNTGNVSSSGSTGSVPVALTAEATTFSVTVPTSIPLNVDASAAVTCADNLKIINNSAGPVEVTAIAVQNNAWSIVSFNGGNRSSLASEKVNSNKLGLALKPSGGTQIATATTGNQNLTPTDGEWVIPAGGNLPFECAGIATAVSASASNVEAAKVVFTLAWKAVYSTPTLISFTIAGTSYQAEKGMTWEEWVNSEYNSYSFTADQYNIYKGAKVVDAVNPSDIINSEGAYSLTLPV